MMLDIHKHYVLLIFYLVTEELKALTALQSHSKAVTQPKGYVCLTLASSSHLRKTPVHKLYSSGLGRHLQSDGPTKGPPVFSQLPLGFHHLYTHIAYECASPFYQHSGSSRRTCLKTGKWSGRHVSCSPGEGSRGPPVVWPLAITTTLTHHMSTTKCDTRIIMWSHGHDVFTGIYLMKRYSNTITDSNKWQWRICCQLLHPSLWHSCQPQSPLINTQWKRWKANCWHLRLSCEIDAIRV